MSTEGNIKTLKVTDPEGNVYILMPVDTEARQTIDEAKSLGFDDDYFTTEETDDEVNIGLNVVPIGVDDTTPLDIAQDDQDGFVIASKSVFADNIAPAFSKTAPYAVGDVVTYNNKVYICTTAIPTTGSDWDSSKWNEYNIADLIAALTTVVSTLSGSVDTKLNKIVAAPLYDENSHSYNADDVVIYEHKLYKSKASFTSSTWDSSKWDELTIQDSIKYFISISFSLLWNNSTTYRLGNIVVYGDLVSGYKLYEYTNINPYNGIWDSSRWREIANLNEVLLNKRTVTEEFSSSSSYKPGEIITYNNMLYKCYEETTQNADFVSNQWRNISLLDLIYTRDIEEIHDFVYNSVTNIIAANKVPKINNTTENTEWNLYNKDDFNQSVSFVSPVTNSEGQSSYPPNSTFAKVTYTLNQGQQTYYSGLVGINGGLYNCGQITPTSPTPSANVYTIPNNSHADLGTIQVTKQNTIVINSINSLNQSANASIKFIIPGSVIYNIRIYFELFDENNSSISRKLLNLVVLDSSFENSSTSVKLESGIYEIIVKGEVGIITTIQKYKETIGDKEYRVTQMPDGHIWMAENLDYKFEVNGVPIPVGVAGSPTTPSAWYYNNDETTYGWTGKKYGLLYNGYASEHLYNNSATLIPGWHIPSEEEWTALVVAVGENAGTKLKSSIEWNSGAGTDDYYFSVFPSGYYAGSFGGDTYNSYIWSSTDSSGNNLCDVIFKYDDSDVTLDSYSKAGGCSVRLIKNYE